MHLNPEKPNILNDMLAHARGIDLRNKDRYKKPSKRYPYSSVRQDDRQRAAAARIRIKDLERRKETVGWG